MSNEPLPTLVIDGRPLALGDAVAHPLVRAVIISLFTWRRANADDALPGQQRMGWWGDNFATAANDRIGSRLWLLARAKMTDAAVVQAREYAEEALAWLVDDGVAARIEVESARIGAEALGVACRLYRNDGQQLADIRFTDVWGYLQ